MPRTFTRARVGAAVLISAALAVSGAGSAAVARAGGSTDVPPHQLTGAVLNDAFDAQYTALGKRVVFAGFDAKDDSGSQPWITDGTPTGTHRIKVITNHTHAHLSNLTGVGKRVFFTTVDDTLQPAAWELWVTNGKASGTKLVHSFPENATSLVPNHLTAVGKRLFFNASSGTGRQLWVSDGTKAGTKLVKKFPDDGDTFEDVAWSMTSLGGKLYFPAEDSAHGIELWVSDGTKAGTKLAVDVDSGTLSSDPEYLTTFKNRLYFTEAGASLFVSDGTPGGTTQLKSGGQGITPYQGYATLDGKLAAYANVSGTNGWMVTDGTQAGTTWEPLPAGLLNEGTFASTGSEILFDARMTGLNDDEELWGTDGTTAGTHRVKDIYPGLTGSVPSDFTSIGKRVVFDAQVKNKGGRLFVSDGTAAGTHQISYRQVTNGFYLDLSYRDGMVFFDTPNSVYYQPWVWEPGPTYLSWCTLKVARHVAHGSHAKATAIVGSSASLAGAGVRLYDGKKKLGTHQLKKGRAVFTLPAGLRVGSHQLRAAFPGHGDVKACSATQKITVTR
jgi:ELWxxDGT repeat protein